MKRHVLHEILCYCLQFLFLPVHSVCLLWWFLLIQVTPCGKSLHGLRRGSQSEPSALYKAGLLHCHLSLLTADTAPSYREAMKKEIVPKILGPRKEAANPITWVTLNVYLSSRDAERQKRVSQGTAPVSQSGSRLCSVIPSNISCYKLEIERKPLEMRNLDFVWLIFFFSFPTTQTEHIVGL